MSVLEWGVTLRREPDPVTDVVFLTFEEALEYVAEHDSPRDPPLKIMARMKAQAAGPWLEWHGRKR